MILVYGLDYIWNPDTERTCKPSWHALIPSTRFLRERLFDWAGSREFDIVRKAQTFTQVELEDYYADVVVEQVKDHLGHSLRTKDEVFLRFAIALELESAAGSIPYRLTFTRCLRLYKAHDGHKLQDCEDVARDAWSRVGWRTPFSQQPKPRKRKTDWALFERCSDHRHPSTADAEIDYCVDCKFNYAQYMQHPDQNRKIVLSKARAAREDDLMEESASSGSDEDEDEDVHVSSMLRQREDADLNNEEYSQLELEGHMMSEEAHQGLTDSLKQDCKGRAFDEVYGDDEKEEAEEEEEGDNEGDILVVPTPQQIQPIASKTASPRCSPWTMEISSMIQQELVDGCSDEEVKWRRRDRREKRKKKKMQQPDLSTLTKHECHDLSRDKANEELHNWRKKGRGRKLVQARKRRRENVQSLVEMGLVPATSPPKRVRFGSASVKTFKA